jgi:hypothetical protein
MSSPISKRRLEMGEDAWAQYQVERKRRKAENWKNNNPVKYKESVSKKSHNSTYWRIRCKRELIAYKGGKCIVCGYDKDFPSAYDFHHRDPKEKEFSISQYSVLNKRKLFLEVDKCDLLCCRCHAELHDEERAASRQIAFDVNKTWEGRKRNELELFCEQCHKRIVTKDKEQRFCSLKCNGVFYSKVKNKPTKEELAALIENNPMTKLGLMFGVSNNAVKKWAKNYGLI